MLLGVVLGYQPGTLQMRSVLTLSFRRQLPSPQVEGSVLQDLPPIPHFRRLSQAQVLLTDQP